MSIHVESKSERLGELVVMRNVVDSYLSWRTELGHSAIQHVQVVEKINSYHQNGTGIESMH